MPWQVGILFNGLMARNTRFLKRSETHLTKKSEIHDLVKLPKGFKAIGYQMGFLNYGTTTN